MADDDALITKAAEAIRHALRTRTWTDPYSGRGFGLSEYEIAEVALSAVRDQIAAEALREAADQCAPNSRETLQVAAFEDWPRARAEALCADESAEEGENGGLGGREAAGPAEGEGDS